MILSRLKIYWYQVPTVLLRCTFFSSKYVSATGVQFGKSCLPDVGKTYDLVIIIHARAMLCTDVIISYGYHLSIIMPLLSTHMVEF